MVRKAFVYLRIVLQLCLILDREALLAVTHAILFGLLQLVLHGAVPEEYLEASSVAKYAWAVKCVG